MCCLFLTASHEWHNAVFRRLHVLQIVQQMKSEEKIKYSLARFILYKITSLSPSITIQENNNYYY